MAKPVKRCTWATSEPALTYHDKEWGDPEHDDRALFEFLILEGAQAGLSWDTILRKRERYRAVFAHFDPRRVARFGDAKLERILTDPGIVRNRLKIYGTVRNAKAFLGVQKEFGTFDAYVWAFAGGKPIRNRRSRSSQLPARTKISDDLSRDLQTRGFTFAGSTICYAFMQAVGIVNDHLVSCFRYSQIT